MLLAFTNKSSCTLNNGQRFLAYLGMGDMAQWVQCLKCPFSFLTNNSIMCSGPQSFRSDVHITSFVGFAFNDSVASGLLHPLASFNLWLLLLWDSMAVFGALLWDSVSGAMFSLLLGVCWGRPLFLLVGKRLSIGGSGLILLRFASLFMICFVVFFGLKMLFGLLVTRESIFSYVSQYLGFLLCKHNKVTFHPKKKKNDSQIYVKLRGRGFENRTSSLN